MKVFLISLCSFGFLLAACQNHKGHIPSQGHHHSHKAGDMNRKFMDPNMNVSKWKEDFESVDRDVYKNRKAIVEALSLRPGDHVADVGAGTGAFLKLLHNKVGSKGKVYANEISPKFIEFMEKRATQEKLTSVKVVRGDAESTQLPSESANVLLLVNVYHHFDDPQAMLKDFKRVLKKDGRLAIVDFNRVPGKSRPWIMKHTRITKDGHIKELASAGFQFVEQKKIPFDENFMLVFKKK